ncbi:hypothetical protein D3C75_882540 [compost metagenome]
MGNRDAIAKTGGAEFFSGYQTFEDVMCVEPGNIPGYEVGDLLENAFLAASRHVHLGTAGGQYVL